MTSQGSKALSRLASQYQTYTRQKCFIAFSKNAPWARDLINGCKLVLEQTEFNLEADYASKHLQTDTPLHEKALELILNSRFGVYDLSWWQDKNGQWQMPRNVYIELGMAIAGNRPTLLVRHASDRGRKLPDILGALSDNVLEFGGVSTLKHALIDRLREWVHVAPDQEWWNRYCILGNRVCEYREVHPRTSHWGKQELWCYISDGFDPDREDFRNVVEDALRKINELSFGYLDAVKITQGYPFLLCSRCQAARSYSFGIYRITPYSSPETFIVLGMSIALQAQFGDKIPKLLIANDANDIPTLLAGYDVVVAQNDTERADMLGDFIPEVVRDIRKTTWKRRPLPFITPTNVDQLQDQTFPTPRMLKSAGILKSSTLFVDRVEETERILRLVENKQSVMIVGDPGIGKTFLLRHIEDMLRERGYFPIFVNLATVASEDSFYRTLTEEIGNVTERKSLRPTIFVSHSMVDQKRADELIRALLKTENYEVRSGTRFVTEQTAEETKTAIESDLILISLSKKTLSDSGNEIADQLRLIREQVKMAGKQMQILLVFFDDLSIPSDLEGYMSVPFYRKADFARVSRTLDSELTLSPRRRAEQTLLTLAAAKRNPVVILDEFGAFFRDGFSRERFIILNWMRELMSSRQVPFVLAGRPNVLQSESSGLVSPFSNALDVIRLESFNREEIAFFWREFGQAELSSKELDSVYSLSRGHPLILRLLLKQIEQAKIKRGEPLDLATMRDELLARVKDNPALAGLVDPARVPDTPE